MEVGGAGTSAAKRRRERRLRSWWRHEAQSVRAAVTTVLHHSCDVGREMYDQKMVTAREVEEHETYDGPRAQKAPPPGARPGLLAEPGPQRSDRSLRRFAGDTHPTLGLPVLSGASGEVVDSSALAFLTLQTLLARAREKRKEEVLAKEEEEKQEKETRLEVHSLLSVPKRKKQRKKKLPKALSSRFWKAATRSSSGTSSSLFPADLARAVFRTSVSVRLETLYGHTESS